VRVTAVIRFIVAVEHLAIDGQNIEWRSSRVGGRNTDRIFPQTFNDNFSAEQT